LFSNEFKFKIKSIVAQIIRYLKTSLKISHKLNQSLYHLIISFEVLISKKSKQLRAMPIVSKKSEKDTKNANEEQKNSEQLKEKKEQKKIELKEKREKELQERRTKRAEEMEKLSKVSGPKGIVDDTNFERLGFQIITTEFATGLFRIYIFVEMCSKLSIYTTIKTRDTITELDAKKWAKQIAEAINTLQLCDIAHRNIRTENIIFDKDINIKIVGFGFATIFWDQQNQRVMSKDRELPYIYSLLGSKVHSIPLFDHLPPEALHCDQYDPLSVDIWSLGVIICIVLNGKSPFNISSAQPIEEQWTQYKAKYESSEESIQLLNRIFVNDISARIKIEELLRHKWISNEIPKRV
jgi:serine/threonine protein kinase